MNLTVDSYVNEGALDISVFYEESEADSVSHPLICSPFLSFLSLLDLFFFYFFYLI